MRELEHMHTGLEIDYEFFRFMHNALNLSNPYRLILKQSRNQDDFSIDDQTFRSCDNKTGKFYVVTFHRHNKKDYLSSFTAYEDKSMSTILAQGILEIQDGEALWINSDNELVKQHFTKWQDVVLTNYEINTPKGQQLPKLQDIRLENIYQKSLFKEASL